METIITIISILCGCSLILNWIFYHRQSTELKDLEVENAELDIEVKKFESLEARLKTSLETTESQTHTIQTQGQEIARLNVALDDKTAMIRKLREEGWAAQQEVNRVNNNLVDAKNEIAEKERFIAELRVASQYLAEWRCEKPECKDPEGRRPPNGKLCGNCFVMPEILRYDRAADAILAAALSEHPTVTTDALINRNINRMD